MKKIIFAFLLCFGLGSFQANELAAQKNYNSALGLRFGWAYGLSYKTFSAPQTAWEFILQSRSYGSPGSRRWGNGFNFTALYQHHGNIPNAKGLNWFVGIGGAVGVWRGYRGHRWFPEEGRSYTVFGVAAILGLEYSFPSAPFSISLDWKPVFNLTGYSGLWGDEGAFTLRYTF